jgi:serine/threonine protein kinase
MTAQSAPSSGTRLPWAKLPAHLLFELESWLGSPVVSAIDQVGGFSPGVAARLQCAGGRSVFVKAVGPELNPDAPEIFRREARVIQDLPTSLPVPRLLWYREEGPDGWVVLVLEDIDGRNPKIPWRPEELDRVVEALVSLSEYLTPSPLAADRSDRVFGERICGWNLLKNRPLPGLDAWSARHLPALARLERAAIKGGDGETLLHLDIRSDNLLLTPDRVYLVDWPLAAIGAPWIDLVFFAPSVVLEGGPVAESLLMRHPAARAAKEDSITAVLAAVSGFFTQRSLLPAPLGLPTVRAFQAAQGEVAQRWLAERTGWR